MNQAIKFLHRPFRQGLVASRAVFTSEYMVLLKTKHQLLIGFNLETRHKLISNMYKLLKNALLPALQLLHNTPIFFENNSMRNAKTQKNYAIAPNSNSFSQLTCTVERNQ